MIGFDLNKEASNYSAKHKKLTERLEKLFPTYWRNLDSTWLVVTTMTASDIRNDLVKLLDANDEILVAGMSGVGAWQGFGDSASKWLKDNL